MSSQVRGAGVLGCTLTASSSEGYDLPPDSFEKEFLIRLAPVWLACRWRVMGNDLTNFGRVWPGQDLGFDLLGMVDYQNEMRLICREELKR